MGYICDRPTKDETLIFLEVFDRLAQFEAEQRMIRGYGVFKTQELPIPEVVVTLNWLKSQFGIN